MTTTLAPPMLIPESAPFTPAQRAWLDGFFAGLLGLGAIPGGGSAELPPAAKPDPIGAETPWHDPALALDERAALAEGKSLPARVMAAMGQLDCGQCGYDCRDYALALTEGREADMGLCQPGGGATQRMVKRLMAEAPTAPAPLATPVATPAATKPTVASGAFVEARPMNGAGSAKDTRAVVVDIAGSGLTYEVGDSLGVHPQNDPELVARLITALGVELDASVTLSDGRTASLGEALLHDCDLGRPSDALFSLLAGLVQDPAQASLLRGYVDGTEDPGQRDVLDMLEQFPAPGLSAAALIPNLGRLQPRLYSIASSAKAHPTEVHLTVGVVKEEIGGRMRRGVASTFFGERCAPGAELKIYIQPSHGFRLPKDAKTPIIMVGPGTGIAPFRGFLQERAASENPGPAWLFFGDQRSATDFLYREELEAFQASGALTRLDLAFSRDQEAKIYVQDRMRENAGLLWSWMQDGAHFYVCGDAQRMARDVDQALRDIARDQGGMDEAAAKAWLAGLAKNGRYARDVY